MQIINGLVHFEANEKDNWEKLLNRKINDIPPQLLRELGEARVRELSDDGYELWARLGAQQVEAIPPSNLH